MSPRVIVVALIVLFVAATSSHAADAKLDALIKRVRKNEALYRNISVSYIEKYNIGKRKAVDTPDFTESAKWTRRVNSTQQDGKFRVESQWTITYPNRKDFKQKSFSVFDGKRTYSRTGDEKQLSAGRRDDLYLARPHMLMLLGRMFRAPLSAYIGGTAAMRKHPGSDLSSGLQLGVEYKGVKKHGKRKCHVVLVTTFTNPPKGREPVAVNADELWLSEDRNLIPVRIRAFTHRWSKTIPIAEYEVTEFQEIKTGVWFPAVAKTTCWKGYVIKRTGTQVIQWRKSLTVDEANLNPKLPAKTFAIP